MIKIESVTVKVLDEPYPHQVAEVLRLPSRHRSGDLGNIF
jgi:hypothetical protein